MVQSTREPSQQKFGRGCEEENPDLDLRRNQVHKHSLIDNGGWRAIVYDIFVHVIFVFLRFLPHLQSIQLEEDVSQASGIRYVATPSPQHQQEFVLETGR
jgi:hypothetical protein